MLILTSLTLVLSFWFIAAPIKRAYREETQRNLDRKLKLYRSWAVRNYYNNLNDLSLEEIEKRFDVRSAYDNMGKRFLRNKD